MVKGQAFAAMRDGNENLVESQDANVANPISRLKVAVNVSGGEQTFPQIMADFSLFVH